MADADFEVGACLGRVRAGDEDAARELVETHYSLVVRVVRGRLPRAVSEEDLIQEIFIKMFSRLEQYRGEVPFSHWLSRIAVTTCLDHLRRQYRRGEWRMADLSEEEARVIEECCSSAAAPDDAVDALAARELALKLLNQLPPKDRMIVSMLDMEGRSVAETSELTGINYALVKVRAFRARRKLRKLMLQWQKERKV
jgi:RNA polymerase sigma factor (sigma-70 family)